MAVSADFTVKAADNSGNSNANRGDVSHKGYAYNDVYGFAHVLEDIETAQEYSGDGKIYAFEGRYAGGYALDNNLERAAVPLPGTVAYGNDVKDGVTPTPSEGTFALLDQMMESYKTTSNLRIPKVEFADMKSDADTNKKESQILAYQ